MIRWKKILVGLGLYTLVVSLAPPAEAQMVYTAIRDGVWTIHWHDGSLAPPRAIQESLGFDANAPALSPDATRVAFEVAGQGLLICPLTTEVRCQTLDIGLGWAARPVWEPRSGELIFVRYTADARGEDSDLFITRNGLEDVGLLVSQTGNQDDPDLSADGRWLAYTSAQTVSLRRAGVRVVRQLWILDLATGEVEPLVPGAYQDQHPDWSPDGESLAFASDRDGDSEIWTVRRDGSGLRRLTSGDGIKSWPAWSPDGRRVVYTRAKGSELDLWVVDVESGRQQRHAGPSNADGERQARRDADWK